MLGFSPSWHTYAVLAKPDRAMLQNNLRRLESGSGSDLVPSRKEFPPLEFRCGGKSHVVLRKKEADHGTRDPSRMYK